MNSARFSIPLALVNLVPVILFAASMGILIADTRNVVFAIGAAFVMIAALIIVVGKLAAAIRKRERPNNLSLFLPLLIIGMLLLVAGTVLMVRNGTMTGAFIRQNVMCHPAIVFLGFSIVGFCLMGVVRTQNPEEEFETNAGLNWQAAVIHIFAQIFLLLTIVFTKINAGTL